MKMPLQILSLIVALGLSIGAIWQSMVVIHFYANQEYIEINYCVNLDKPELNCHGKCHLNASLSTGSEILSTETTSNYNLKTALIILTFRSCPKIEIVEPINQKSRINSAEVEETSTFINPILNPPESQFKV